MSCCIIFKQVKILKLGYGYTKAIKLRNINTSSIYCLRSKSLIQRYAKTFQNNLLISYPKTSKRNNEHHF